MNKSQTKKEDPKKIRGILEDINIKSQNKYIKHYINNYASGVLSSLNFLNHPKASAEEIQEIYKQRVFFLLLLKRALKQQPNNIKTFLQRKHDIEKRYQSKELECFFTSGM